MEKYDIFFIFQFSSVLSLSHVWLFATPWITARQASLSITNSRSSVRLTSIESVMPSSHLILCHPLLLLPPIPPSIRVFSNESTLRMRWPKYWSFSFSIIPSKEIPGLISFRMDWLDLLAVQGTLQSLLQHHSSKASILWHSSPSPHTLNLSQHQGLFKWISSSHQVAKVLEFQLQHQSLQWIYWWLISFRMDWLDLLAVQGTLKSLLQHHSSKASIFRLSHIKH